MRMLLSFSLVVALLLGNLENMFHGNRLAVVTYLAWSDDALALKLVDQVHQLLGLVFLLKRSKTNQEIVHVSNLLSHLLIRHSLHWASLWWLKTADDRIDRVLQSLVFVGVAILAVARILLLVLAVPAAEREAALGKQSGCVAISGVLDHPADVFFAQDE